MKRKLMSILALLCLAVSGAWAESVNCSSSDIGKLIGSDGEVYATASPYSPEYTLSMAKRSSSNKRRIAINETDSLFSRIHFRCSVFNTH